MFQSIIFLAPPKTEAQLKYERLCAALPENSAILAKLQPVRPPKSTKSFEEAEAMGIRLEYWSDKTGARHAVIDTRQPTADKRYVTRCYTKAEAQLVARAVAEGAVYGWIESGPMRGQHCISGPDWAPHCRPDLSGLHPNSRKALKEAEKNLTTALAAHFAGMITEKTLHEIIMANTERLRR